MFRRLTAAAMLGLAGIFALWVLGLLSFVVGAKADAYYFVQGNLPVTSSPSTDPALWNNLYVWDNANPATFWKNATVNNCPSTNGGLDCIGQELTSWARGANDVTSNSLSASYFNSCAGINYAGLGVHSGTYGTDGINDDFSVHAIPSGSGNYFYSGGNYGFCLSASASSDGTASQSSIIDTALWVGESYANWSSSTYKPWNGHAGLVDAVNVRIVSQTTGADSGCSKTQTNAWAVCGDNSVYLTDQIVDPSGNVIVLNARIFISFASDGACPYGNACTYGSTYVADGEAYGGGCFANAFGAHTCFFNTSPGYSNDYVTQCDVGKFTVGTLPNGPFCAWYSATQLGRIITYVNALGYSFDTNAAHWMLLNSALEVGAISFANGNYNATLNGYFASHTVSAMASGRSYATRPMYQWTQQQAGLAETFLVTPQGGADYPWTFTGVNVNAATVAFYAYRLSPGGGYTGIIECENNNYAWDFMPYAGSSCPAGYTKLFDTMGYVHASQSATEPTEIVVCVYATGGVSSHMTLTRAAANSICTGGNGWSVAFTLGWTPNN